MTPDARNFHNKHQGETGLIVCNGPSLNDLPLDLLKAYPSIGCNSLVEWEAFTPSYWVAVDDRVRREYGDLVAERYADVPKLIAHPNLEQWTGDNFYWWLHRPGPLWEEKERISIPPTWLTEPGITWYCCPHAMLQIALFMGFTRLLVVGMDHSHNRKEHAWGVDEGMRGPSESRGWWNHVESGHEKLMIALRRQGVEITNISPGSCERVFPRGDWRDWI